MITLMKICDIFLVRQFQREPINYVQIQFRKKTSSGCRILGPDMNGAILVHGCVIVMHTVYIVFVQKGKEFSLTVK